MKLSTRNHRPLPLLLVILLGLTAGPGRAEAPSAQKLNAEFKKALAATVVVPGDGKPSPTRYADSLEMLLAQGKYLEAEQMLIQLKSGLPGSNETIGGLIEKLLSAVRAESAALAAKQETACAAIEKDFVAKFNAKAPAAAYDPLLKQLAALFPPGTYGNPNAQRAELLRTFISRWQDYLLQTARGNHEQAAQSLNELVQQSSRLPILPRSELANLQAEAAGRVSTRNEPAEARLATLQQQLTTLIDSAKGAADFDPFIVELAKPLQVDGVLIRSGNYGNQLETLRRFAARWQDYYSQLDAGNGPAALTVLKELAGNPAYEIWYPRSRLLARINGKAPGATDPDAASPLISPEKLTLDNLDQFARQLVARRPMTAPNPLEDVTAETLRLRTFAAQIKFGNFEAAFSQLNVPSDPAKLGNYGDALTIVRESLRLKALPGVTRAPREVQPAAQDSVESFVNRLLQYGREHKDWQLIWWTLIKDSEMRRARPGQEGSAHADLEGYRLFFAGLAQEWSGLWTMATRSYFAAQLVPSPNLPVEEITARLAGLKKAHPNEYALAEQQPVPEPVVPVNGRVPPGYYLVQRNNETSVARDPLTQPPVIK